MLKSYWKRMLYPISCRVFNLFFFVSILLALQFGPITSYAQDSLNQKNSSWIPDYCKIQTGGGIGLVSAGFGYQKKNGKAEADFNYGYVPSKYGELNHLTLRFGWLPIKSIQIKSGFETKPVVFSFLASYSPHQNFFVRLPDHYPKRYYDHPTALHAALGIGSRIDYRFNNSQRTISFFTDYVFSDYELVSLALNRSSLKLKELGSFAFGLRYKFAR